MRKAIYAGGVLADSWRLCCCLSVRPAPTRKIEGSRYKAISSRSWSRVVHRYHRA